MSKSKPENGKKWVYAKYIVKNGKKYYPKKAKCFVFLANA